MHRKIASALILSIVFFPAFLTAEEAAAKAGVNSVKAVESANAQAPAAKETFALNGKKISIEDAIKLVLKNNRDVLDARYDAKMADSNYQKFLSKYSIYLGAEGNLKYQDNPDSTEMGQGKNIKTYDASVSAFKNFSTGTSVTAGFKEAGTKTDYISNPLHLPVYDASGVRTDSYVPYSLGDKEYYTPAIFVSVQQELLKNSFGYADRKQEQMLKNVTKLVQTGQEARISGLVAGALVDIWDVTLKKTARDNATISLRETKKVRDIVAANARLGISETFELNLYNAMYAGAEATFTQAEKEYNDAIRKLFRTLDVQADDKVDVTDVLALSTELKDINVEAALKAAFAKRADYANAVLSEENSRLELGIARNGLLPSLTAGASVTSYSYNQKLADANSDMAAFNSPILGVTVKASYPLFDSGAAVTVRDAEYKSQQTKLRLEKARREIKDDVVSKADQIRVMYSSYQKMKVAREESERYFWSIQNYLRMGKAKSADVKTALDTLTSSRQRELQVLIYYNQSLLGMDLATNELLEKYNVDVRQYLKSAE
jgi:outer membrane protein TolC